MIDAQQVVRDWLAARFAPKRVVTSTPANLQAVLPVIRVVRIGGRDRDYVMDMARFGVDVFAATAPGARVVAEQVRDAVKFELSGALTGGAFVTHTETFRAPVEVPWADNALLTRVYAEYDVTLKRA